MVSFIFAGVRWRVSFGFLAGVAAFLFVDAGGFALAFLGAAALHELGHLAVMALLRAPVRVVELRLSCMGIQRGGKLGFGGELALLLAGVGGNLLFALLLYLFGGAGALRFSAVNAALAVFHLLPLGGLDGGSVLELLCVHALGAGRGDAVARRVSAAFTLAALGGLVWLTVCFGWSAGTVLLGMLLLCGLLWPKGF